MNFEDFLIYNIIQEEMQKDKDKNNKLDKNLNTIIKNYKEGDNNSLIPTGKPVGLYNNPK
ncbi:MAG: hypothetical protein ACI4SM_03440 [Candidatus Gastranaerophilaceae bacterium]